MFLAIINDTYSVVKEEDLQSRIQLGQFFKKQLTVIWNMCPKWKYCKKNKIEKEENEGLKNIDEPTIENQENEIQ